MSQFHHKKIKQFSLNGQIHDESSIPRLKGEYIRLIVTEMRETGYSPRFDIEPDFTIEYIEDKEYFHFELSVYGVYVGKRNSKWIVGIDGYKAIYIQQNKSSESLQDQASPLK